MSGLYSIGIWLYEKVLRLVAFVSPKATEWQAGRAIIPHTFSKLAADRQTSLNWQLAWFHCASLGEFEQGRPVIEAFRQAYPDFKILLTFFSPSGYNVRKNYAGADYITYLPLDRPRYVREFLDATRPSIAFFVKYEFWRNFITQTHRRGIRLYSFATILRPEQIYFKKYGSFFREILFRFEHIFAQNKATENLLHQIGYQKVTLAGDTRFDRVAAIAAQRKSLPVIERFKGSQPLLVVGSAWAPDVAVLKDFLASQPLPHLRVVIAPHEIHDSEMGQWANQLGRRAIRYSEVTETTDLQAFDTLFVDNIGMLSNIYAYADAAYIGGALGKGLHNTLEAATYGIPLFFGDKAYHKFQEALDLQALGGAFAVASGADWARQWAQVWPQRHAIGQQVAAYVQSQLGATARIMQLIRQELG